MDTAKEKPVEHQRNASPHNQKGEWNSVNDIIYHYKSGLLSQQCTSLKDILQIVCPVKAVSLIFSTNKFLFINEQFCIVWQSSIWTDNKYDHGGFEGHRLAI